VQPCEGGIGWYYLRRKYSVEKIGTIEAIEDFAREKRRTLFERVALFAVVMSLFHFVQDLIAGADEAPFLDISITIILLTCFLLHKRGRFHAARIIGLSFLNLLFVVYACLVPAEVGIYLFYFPLMAISMGVFGRSESVMRIFFVVLSAALQFSLFLTDFDLIGPYEIEAPNVEMFFLINLGSSAFILVICINFILNVNEESERRLHILADEVKEKNDNLEKTNAELDRFFYSTSHDLRSPLLSIKGLVNIARHDTRDPHIQQYLAMMAERVDKLDSFINDIIDYSRNARTEILKEPVNVEKLLDDVTENFKFLDGAERITFNKNITVSEVIVDKSRLTIVLSNLISNAIKYHNTHQAEPWISATVSQTQNNLALVIADNGPGISSEKQSKIFEMFYRGTEQSKGSGLGLYIAKEAIEKMNGTIAVESTEGIGTTFIVSLPLAETDIA